MEKSKALWTHKGLMRLNWVNVNKGAPIWGGAGRGGSLKASLWSFGPRSLHIEGCRGAHRWGLVSKTWSSGSGPYFLGEH